MVKDGQSTASQGEDHAGLIDFGPHHRCVQATDTRPMSEASDELGSLGLRAGPSGSTAFRGSVLDFAAD